MKKLKMMAMIIGWSAITNIAVAELQAEKAVINDPASSIAASANFPTPVSGDLYVATQVGGQYFFLNDGGQFTPEVMPFSQATEHSGKIPLFNIPAKGSTPGRYPLFQVVANPGTDPLNFNNWVGGLGGLSTINFTIGLPPSESGDFDNNGFADDDNNNDGFHDDDLNKDGYHDDDFNKDGYHDDDNNKNGIHDSRESNPHSTINTIATTNCPDQNTVRDVRSGDDGGFNNENEGGVNNEGNVNSEGSDNSFNNNCVTTATPTPVTTPVTTQTPPVTSNPLVAEGQGAYASCASSGCHGANPAFNQNGILRGRNPSATMSAIARNKGGMGFLSTIITADSANKISAYLNSL